MKASNRCSIRYRMRYQPEYDTFKEKKFGSAASLRENCSYQPCTTFTGTYGPSALFTMSALLAENDKA
ncbi:hypothetical protein T01_4410 [Trichinella spiralis]|uniref:Uncharacterized protein n=1 Tax=Trichinella spiralis TaxID=6334 RepID=A0A0V1AWW5_TRISP|nr:hypothetical protein T01_4410 [Trichinella spiralis]